MRRPVVALLAVLAVAAVACRRGDPDDPKKTDWRVVQLYGGPGSVEALARPRSVEAFRIDPVASEPRAGVAYCGVHAVTGGPFPLSAEDGAALSRVLRDPDTYDWRRAKGDAFRPTIGVRFTREASRVDLALDLECHMLTVHRQGRRVGVEDFDDAADAIRAIVERTVPADGD